MPAYSPAFLRSRPWLSGSATVAPVAGAAAVDLSLGRVFYVLLDANTTITLSSPTDGEKTTFIFEQGGTGSYTVTFDPVPLVSGVIDLTDAVGSVDVVTMIYSAALSKYLAAQAADFV